MYFEAMAS